MDSTVVSNSPVDHLFCVVEDVSLRCVVCIIDTLDIQLMSARVDIRSTTNTGKPFLLLPWVENAQKFVTEISKWTNSKRFETLIHAKNVNISYCRYSVKCYPWGHCLSLGLRFWPLPWSLNCRSGWTVSPPDSIPSLWSHTANQTSQCWSSISWQIHILHLK